MKIFIQARKNGYNILYPKPTPSEFYHFAIDLQSISARNDVNYYGKSFYTLAFSSGGCIFTKYVIGYDTLRNNLGNIAISAFIPYDKRLSGNNLKILLDELLNTYCTNYCPDYQIKDNYEDWILFTSLANSYDKLLENSLNDENFTAGTQDPAFHYYKTENELIEHLDKPLQVEYKDYKQILFVDFNSKQNGNPLDVLKISGVEVNPDLSDSYFYLNNSSSIPGVRITANEKLIFDGRGNNKIRAKSLVNISYSLDNRCHEPINVTGRLSDLQSDLYKYLETKGDQILLIKESFDKKIVKPVHFVFKDNKDNSLAGIDIKIGPRDWFKTNDTIISINFIGEEIIRSWNISAKRESESLYLDAFPFTPNDYNQPIVLTLQKKLVLKIFAIDVENGNTIPNFKYSSDDGKTWYDCSLELIFYNDDINKTWTIKVQKKEGQYLYQGSKQDFTPADGPSTLHIDCQKYFDNHTYDKEAKQEIREHCEKPDSDKKNPTDRNLNDFNSSKSSLRKRNKILFLLAVICFVIVLGILSYIHFFAEKDHRPTSLSREEIMNYVNGNDFKLNTLDDYLFKWNSLEQDYIKKSRDFPFVGSVTKDSTEWKNIWNPILDTIKNAKEKRNIIDSKDFSKLQKLFFSTDQTFFIETINKINKNKFSTLIVQLDDISNLSLIEIATKINDLLNSPTPPVTDPPTPPVTKNPTPPVTNPTTSPASNNTLTEEDKKIVLLLQTDEFKKSDIEAHLLKCKNKSLISSLKLCLKFWNLDGSNNNPYPSYKAELDKSEHLKLSKLKSFVDQMSNKQNPKYTIRESDKNKKLSKIFTLLE